MAKSLTPTREWGLKMQKMQNEKTEPSSLLELGPNYE